MRTALVVGMILCILPFARSVMCFRCADTINRIDTRSKVEIDTVTKRRKKAGIDMIVHILDTRVEFKTWRLLFTKNDLHIL